jgi:hypothetical protein
MPHAFSVNEISSYRLLRINSLGPGGERARNIDRGKDPLGALN